MKLSLPALETLAVIAYKQPVTAPEIMEIRGVQGAGVLKTLLDRKLIAVAGRKNVIGKPILYKTTKEFLIQFGLKDLSELPSLKEFEEIRRMAFADSKPLPEAVAPAEAADANRNRGRARSPGGWRGRRREPEPAGAGSGALMPEERLQKILSQAGVASRRHSEQLIAEGRVTVNGAVVTELGSKADLERDHIKVDGRLLRPPKHMVYIALHKPDASVTTVSDPEGRVTVMEMLRGVKERVYPVGRLDYHSEGLLLFTNDGELANAVMSAATHLPKDVSGKSQWNANARSGTALPRGSAAWRTAHLPAGLEAHSRGAKSVV